MTPYVLSGETGQDSEPNIAVNPSKVEEIAGTAFTANPGGGPLSPIYYSVDRGNSWNLLEIIDGAPVLDQTLRFASIRGTLYAALLWGTGGIDTINYDILRAGDFTGLNPMILLARRTKVDQPFIQAITVPAGPDIGKDRVYVGSNDWAPVFANPPGFPIATVDYSLDASNANPAFSTVRLESRSPQRDGYQTRPAVHPDGTVYAIFYSWMNGSTSSDVVICRDDNWGIGSSPFTALVDPIDNNSGLRVVTGVNCGAGLILGQQRIGGDLSIAVDPRKSSTVYICWGDRTGGVYTLHVRKSADKGATWSSKDLFSVDNATNPALAISTRGVIGFLFQQVVDQRWQTKVLLTGDDFRDTVTHILSDAPADAPLATYQPYLGDYLYMMAVGEGFYGIFCANNAPDDGNFPSGRPTYQRLADWNTNQLLDLNGNVVQPSIDPFFFEIEQMAIPIEPGNVVKILAGVIADSGGIIWGPRGPIRVPPWGPEKLENPSEARDLLIGVLLDRFASEISTPYRRNRIKQAISEIYAQSEQFGASGT